jgi:hypothetical protein
MTNGWPYRIVAILRWLVPRERRADWQREWEAELQHFESRLAPAAGRHWRLLQRVAGSVADASYLAIAGQRDQSGASVVGMFRAIALSLVACVAVLAISGIVGQAVEDGHVSYAIELELLRVGTISFAIAAALLCAPVFMALSAFGRMPRPLAAAALGLFLSALPTLALTDLAFGGPHTLAGVLAGWQRDLLETIFFACVFAVPGATFGFVWARQARERQSRVRT